MRKKHLDFELNLIPFIDLLSVCICFLLLTAVWLNIGSIDVKQAFGGEAQSASAKKPSLTMVMSESGDLSIRIQDTSKVPINLNNSKLKIDKLPAFLSAVHSLEPTLNTALIQPAAGSLYEDIIAVMDILKDNGLTDLGVVPL